MVKKLLVGILIGGITYAFYLGGAQLGYWSGGFATGQPEWDVEYINSSKQTQYKMTNSKPDSADTPHFPTATANDPPKYLKGQTGFRGFVRQSARRP